MKNYSLISCILRSNWDETALESARKIAATDNFDWDNLQQIVDSEGLAPLFYHLIKGKNVVPASVEDKWRNTYYYNGCRNTLLLRELTKILNKLAVVGVDTIVLKGAALADIVYGDIAARPMSDLDLLIHQNDLSITRQVLAELGYRRTGVDMQVGFTEEFRNEEIFYKGGLVETYIDLHWRLIAPVYYQRTFDKDWFWETSLPTKINQIPAMVLGLEAQIVYLCAHLMLHHGGESLLWLYDIAKVIDFYQKEIDWKKVINQTKKYDLVLSVKQILIQLADDWKIQIPANFVDELRSLQPSRDEVRTYIWQHQTMALRLFDDVAGAKDWRQRLRMVWDTLFPTFEYMQHRYRISHRLLVPFYYPYRWLRGLRRVPGS